jgi:hypothetical protein
MPGATIELEKRLRPSASYSSKIIKAGALIGDTKTLLSHWDVDASVDANINRVQRDNVFGKASRSRVEAILAILRQRYLTEESVTKALVTLNPDSKPIRGSMILVNAPRRVFPVQRQHYPRVSHHSIESAKTGLRLLLQTVLVSSQKLAPTDRLILQN